MNRILSIVLIFSLVLSTLFFAACSSDSDGLLKVNLGGNPSTLDPQKAGSARDISVALQFFDGLLEFNKDLTLKPVVAKEVPSYENGGISGDGLLYTFHLREGVTWSDGKPVTADDFVYSIRRLFYSETRAPYRSVFYVIKNAIPFRKGEVTEEAIGVRAVDDLTLEITLESPTHSFLERMALWAVYPIRQDVVEMYGDDWSTSPDKYVGNGPFLLKEWVKDDHITIERNPNYWGTPAGLDGVRFAMYEDAATEYLAYMSGDLDITRIPVGTERTLGKSEDLLTYPRLKTNALFFDTGEPPFDNVKLRQALSMAIDRNSLVNDLQGGRGTVTYCWIPPGMSGYEAGYQESCGSQYSFDVAMAKQTLSEAGFPDGEGLPPITLLYSNVGSNPTIAQFIQGQLEANLGVNVDAVGVGSAAYWGRVFDEHDKWDIAYVSFSADYPDPDNWLPDFFTTDGGYNVGIAQYSNSQFDTIVAHALVQTDRTQRLAIWKEAESVMVDDAPAIFLFNDEMFVLKKENIKGIVGTPMDLYIPGDLFLAEISKD